MKWHVPTKNRLIGSRRIRDWLWEEGYDINRKRVQRLMRQMGITALYPKKATPDQAYFGKMTLPEAA